MAFGKLQIDLFLFDMHHRKRGLVLVTSGTFGIALRAFTEGGHHVPESVDAIPDKLRIVRMDFMLET